MIVMTMRMEDSFNLVDPDAERGEAVVDVRSGIDQVNVALVH